ncbi:olfactory receptor 5V1-like [Ambystoma mexicanum]|uniref:olfactory receptor 5V1-like n=1 Tax=Ambystoma mexicanum TaxID=8296 RepID=UPI0037E80A8A
MKEDNLSAFEDFFIVGFSDLPKLQVPLFAAFSLIYLMTLVGNLLIMITIYSNSHLHTPMYFFIGNLSFIDICGITIIFPLMLSRIFQNGTHMSLAECLVQAYCVMVMISTEFLLLSVMAYDRYVAICNPLRYMTIMSKAVCMRWAAGIWVLGFVTPVPHTVLVSKLTFCESHTVNHFFCEVPSLMKLSCSSTYAIETLSYILGAVELMMSFLLIIISYINIVSSILKMKSKGGRTKAFSTSASHLIVVILFYGSICSTYVRPTSSYSMQNNKLLSLLYIVITPLFNPVIYSLKNAEFKMALRKTKNSGQIAGTKTDSNIAKVVRKIDI